MDASQNTPESSQSAEIPVENAEPVADSNTELELILLTESVQILSQESVAASTDSSAVSIEAVVGSCPEEADDGQASEATADGLYQPSMEELVDDEGTLDDEEKLAEEDEGELDELEKLGEMPIEELLRLYGAPGSGTATAAADGEQSASCSAEPVHTSGDLAARKTDDDWTTSSDEDDNDTEEPDDPRKCEDQLKLMNFLAKLSGQPQEAEDSDSDDDDDFIPAHMVFVKRETPIGPNHQAEVPEVNGGSDDVDFADEILQWAPRVPEDLTIDFLKAAYIQERKLLQKEINSEQTEQLEVADDEEFLKEFLDCNFDKEEALRRCRRNFRPGRYESSKWSEQECESFEKVMAESWKRFTVVQAAVPTRTVKELVEFYYRWKKSSRFEVFLSKLRFPEGGKGIHHLEEKVKVRMGKKRPFDAMDAVAEDQLAVAESLEPRAKSSRIENAAAREDHQVAPEIGATAKA